MIFKKVDHIAFAVKDLEAAKKKMIEGFGGKLLFEKEVPEQQYTVAILRVGESIFSLLESTTPDGFVAKHIEKFGEGVQHIGIQVDNLEDTLKTWEALGYKTTAVEEVPGVRRQVLLSPKSGFGVVFQVQDWLGEYKYATDEERFRPMWS
jgi:methylmalonyl-CoA epimerase